MVTIFSVDISPKGTIDSPKGGTIAREQFSFTLPHDNIKRRNSCHSLYYLCETVAPPIRRYSSVILPSEQVEHGSDHEDYSSDHSSNEAYEESNNLLQDQLHRSGHADTVSDLFRRALAKSPVARKAALSQHESAAICKHRAVEYWCGSKVRPDEHIWLPSSGPSSSRDTECYVGERDCRKVGDKQSCAACHIVAHTACIPMLQQLHMKCKQTFYEESPVKKQVQGDDTYLGRHHWVHKWKHEGRCLRCGKSFQQKIFREKEVIAITCSWCKRSYHNRVGCFSSQCFEEICDRGDLKEAIVPPSWIMFSQAVRKRTRKEHSRKKRRMFLVKPTDDNIQYPSEPLLVFVNPKSGGNKGFKLLNTLCWLLNPRQVFDINTMQGPKFGLEMFRKVSGNLRLLVCGGDGTVGWVLSVLDKINWPQYPPIGIVPLGTGNDLARCLGWGGSFSEEPMARLLQSIIHETSITHLDRWNVCVTPNNQSSDTYNDEIDEAAQSELPLTVMNNYFSIGADAHVALQFHHSRSANPQMLNSRLKNRIAYGGLGTIDLFKRAWKSLHEYITLECDGMDLTARIKEFKFHCILFHNITYYAGGTVPWGTDCDESCKPSSCDGRFEVLGFTTASLAALQMGGKGERIAQCSEARITTTKAIPMQVDGEPCLLAPSIIQITFHSQVPMLRREKKLTYTPGAIRKNPKLMKQPAVNQPPSSPVNVRLPVLIVALNDYRTYRDHLERLKASATEVGMINAEAEAELDSIRQKIAVLFIENANLKTGGDTEWRFLDYVSSAEEGVFRVSRHQEQITTLSDICSLDECVILLDEVPRKPPPLKKAAKSFERSEISCGENGVNGDTVQIVFRSDTQETHL